MCTSSPRIVETALFADEQSDSMLRKKLGKSDSPWDSVILTDRRSPHRNDSLEDRLFPQGCPACLPKDPHFHWPARALLLKVLAAWEGALPRASALARVSRARARRRPTPAAPRNNAAVNTCSPFEYTMYRWRCSRAAGSPPACSARSRRRRRGRVAGAAAVRRCARAAGARARARARALSAAVVEPSARVARRVALRQARRSIRSSASTTASTRARRTPSSKPSASATSARSHCASAPTGARRRRKGSSGARRPSTSSTSRRRSRSRTSSSRIVTCSSRRRRPTIKHAVGRSVARTSKHAQPVNGQCRLLHSQCHLESPSKYRGMGPGC